MREVKGFLLTALAGAGLALAGCQLERHAGREPAAAAAPPAAAPIGRTAGAPAAIAVVPASPDLMHRAAAGGALIRKLLEAAQPRIGTPYKMGGADLAKGIDCSNFTWLLYRSIGVPYDRYIRTRELATLHRTTGLTRTTFADARPGDLLVYGHRDGDGDWHGHVVILVDKTGEFTGQPGLMLGAHGTPVGAVAFVTTTGFDAGWFRTPEMRLLNVLRPAEPASVQ